MAPERAGRPSPSDDGPAFEGGSRSSGPYSVVSGRRRVIGAPHDLALDVSDQQRAGGADTVAAERLAEVELRLHLVPRSEVELVLVPVACKDAFEEALPLWHGPTSTMR